MHRKGRRPASPFLVRGRCPRPRFVRQWFLLAVECFARSRDPRKVALSA